ncbi:MAG: efflux RND transporter periplasmic adaptor subunit [Candidatus Hydrogenedentes bacterium]|nr:efflux RND transporter periplasmic adaptor subunit [Candidatus Hydrogenedentota bacterium]
MKAVQYLIVPVILCGVILALAGCGSKDGNLKKGKTKKPALVQVATAESMRMVEQLETTGNVVAVNTVMIKATIEGPIAYCPWREGDRVEEAGQRLVEIDRPLYRQEVVTAKTAENLAKAKLDDLIAGARPEEIAQASESVRQFADCTNFAKADMERVQSLVTSGSLPGEEVEKARVNYVKCSTQLGSARELVTMLKAGPTRTEIAVQQAAVDEAIAKTTLAQKKLDECLLTAPFAGIITEVFIRPGDLATPRTPLLKMMDPSTLVVRVGLPESCSAHITKGTPAVVRFDMYPNKTFNAVIERVYPRLELDSRTRMVEVKVTDPVELIPRLFARVSVQGRVIDDAVVIPDAAIITTPRGDKNVYVVEEGKAICKTVTIGLEQGTHIQIIEGIEAGDIVVTDGNLNLKKGASVRVDKEKKDMDNTEVSGKDTK